MGLFKKKRRKLEMSDNSHKKGRRRDSLLTSFDKLEYAIVSENSTDDDLLKICDIILSGRAVLTNFEKLDPTRANEMLAFISGVVYAKEGEAIKLDSRLFLFGRKEEFEDGSLYQYVEDTR